MDRRDFLKTTGAIVAGATVASGLPGYAAESAPAATGAWCCPSTAIGASAPPPRTRPMPATSTTRFYSRHRAPYNLREPWHSFDEKSYEFVSVYRRRFRLPAETRGQRVFVDFEGVMTASKVWLNGEYLGEYKGGFTPFSFELTPTSILTARMCLPWKSIPASGRTFLPSAMRWTTLHSAASIAKSRCASFLPLSLKTFSRNPRTYSPVIRRWMCSAS